MIEAAFVISFLWIIRTLGGLVDALKSLWLSTNTKPTQARHGQPQSLTDTNEPTSTTDGMGKGVESFTDQDRAPSKIVTHAKKAKRAEVQMQPTDDN